MFGFISSFFMCSLSSETPRRKTWLPFDIKIVVVIFLLIHSLSSFPLYTYLHQEGRESSYAIPSTAGYGKLKS